ncbi:BTAD domain-containing putative transcriptional regulator [Streptomyces cyaneofuscatus]|uniref:BTAD domain-containing putative transcriptional regulator n=1 Tax=Streptomyces cyaneofuscatus TaxID=66883 RepID=UPI0034270C34
MRGIGMWFRMLGPLEVVADGRPVDLGGSKQRATLGLLLLQPGRVVPTSRLLTALWSEEEAPATARKILQNAVWGLRRRLSVLSEDGRAGVTLSTRAPGYTLEVAPERIDLHLFRQMATEGRAHLASGAPEEAARHLESALKLWRGAVLSDLTEVGIVWPEVTTVQNARLDVLEDWFEAQLECGRHASVLGEIATLVENEPLRERACGQLMRALYRCGRQADALGVYRRLRASLVEDLGLEPSRELRLLHQAILEHDPALHSAQQPAVRMVAPAATPDPPARRHVSVVLVRAGFDRPAGEPGEADLALDEVDLRIRQEIESRGGTVVAALGTDTLGLFPGRPYATDHAERAVRTAIAVCDTFARAPGAAVPGGIAVKAAVVTGEALLRRRGAEGGAAPLSVSGMLPHVAQTMLPQVPDGEFQICPATRKAVARPGGRERHVELPGRRTAGVGGASAA